MQNTSEKLSNGEQYRHRHYHCNGAAFHASMCATIVNECLDSVNVIYQENDGLDY